MPKADRLPVDELLRLACIYAEQDRQEYAAAIHGCDAEAEQETAEFLRQLRAYRLRRWGKTKLETWMDGAKEVSVSEVAARLNAPTSS